MQLCTTRNDICEYTIAQNDTSDNVCSCIDQLMAKDFRLLASRLYEAGVTQPWTCHVQPWGYNEPPSQY